MPGEDYKVIVHKIMPGDPIDKLMSREIARYRALMAAGIPYIQIPRVIVSALAHVAEDTDHKEYLARLLRAWADYLDDGKPVGYPLSPGGNA